MYMYIVKYPVYNKKKFVNSDPYLCDTRINVLFQIILYPVFFFVRVNRCRLMIKMHLQKAFEIRKKMNTFFVFNEMFLDVFI
jgi:hypothetical protein